MLDDIKGLSNIIRTIDQANTNDISKGMVWYEEARRFCIVIGKRYNLNPNIVAAVLVTLSPRNRWERNKIDCVSLIKAHRLGLDPSGVRVATFDSNRLKAVNILRTGIIDIKGPKVSSFFDNITNNDSSKVTVDVHAMSIYKGSRYKNSPSGIREYNQVERAYKQVALALNIKPYQAQAISWVAYKRMNNI
jgi:hypothetical protein